MTDQVPDELQGAAPDGTPAEPPRNWQQPRMWYPQRVTLAAGQTAIVEAWAAPEFWIVFDGDGWDGGNLRAWPGESIPADYISLRAGVPQLIPGMGQRLTIANPTAASVTVIVVAVTGFPFTAQPDAARQYGFDGSDWRRIVVGTNGLLRIGTTFAGIDGDVNTLAGITSAAAGGSARLAVASSLFNGASWDRQRNNEDRTLLASAARTASVNVDVTNFNHRGLVLLVNVTAITATPVVTPTLRLKDPISGGYQNIWAAAVNITGVGLTTYLFYPGVISTAAMLYTEEVGLAVPRSLNLLMTHGDTDSITYSVAAGFIL